MTARQVCNRKSHRWRILRNQPMTVPKQMWYRVLFIDDGYFCTKKNIEEELSATRFNKTSPVQLPIASLPYSPLSTMQKSLTGSIYWMLHSRHGPLEKIPRNEPMKVPKPIWCRVLFIDDGHIWTKKNIEELPRRFTL